MHRVAGRGSFWQGVTGALDEGETLLQAAIREVFEETQLSPIEICPVDFTYSFPVSEEWRESYVSNTNEIVEHVFVAEVCDNEPTLSQEHDAWKWRPPDEAADMLKWQNNVDALWRCEAFLAAQ